MNQPDDRPGLLERIKDLLAWPESEPERDRAEPARVAYAASSRPRPQPRRRGPADVVAMPSLDHPAAQVKRPATRREVKEIGDCFKAGKLVILDLERVRNAEDKRYIVAFLSGLTHGLDGKAKRVTGNVYVFAPSRFQVETPEPAGQSSIDDWVEEHLMRDLPLLDDAQE